MKRFLLEGPGRGGLSRLRQEYPLRKESAGSSDLVYRDSVDGRLFARGEVLFSEGGRLVLARAGGGRVAEAAFQPRGRSLFWWDLPEGRLAERLRSGLDVRAAVPILTVKRTTVLWRVLDAEEKTVARLTVVDAVAVHEGGEAPLPRTLEVLPVRGYGKDLRRIASQLAKAGLSQHAEGEYALARKVLGLEPQAAKPPRPLWPRWSAERASRALLLDLIREMRVQEAGIGEDLDTEFLHEFRVAVRRMRVLLAELADVLPPDSAEQARADFAHIGRVTGRLRDLDVILLNARDYRSMVPGHLATALDAFFARLRVARREELAAVVEALGSQPYRGIVDRWETTFGRPIHGSKKGRAEAGPLFARIVARRLARLRRLLASLNRRTDANDVHRLRLQCKKLRYLTEAFAPVLPPLESLEKQLALLQGQLGRQHDLAVQQSTLRACLQQMEPGERDDLEMAAAIGALTASLEREQEAVARDFRRSLDQVDRRARAGRVTRFLERRGA